MTSAKADCIMRFICLMQERLLPISGEPLLGIRSKRYNKFQFVRIASLTRVALLLCPKGGKSVDLCISR